MLFILPIAWMTLNRIPSGTEGSYATYGLLRMFLVVKPTAMLAVEIGSMSGI